MPVTPRDGGEEYQTILQIEEEDLGGSSTGIRCLRERPVLAAGVAATLVALVVGLAVLGGRSVAAQAAVAERAAVGLEAAAPRGKGGLICAAHEESCLDSQCCREDGMQCFEKNEYWAVCQATCEPGVHKGDDDGKEWTCGVLLPPTAAPAPPPPPSAACSREPGEDCSLSKCCEDPELHCWEKNEYYATCMTKCDTGVHEGDADGKPWSCKQLLPGMLDTTTTIATAEPEKPTPLPQVDTPPIICDSGAVPGLPQFQPYAGPQDQMVKVLTYNLFWWSLFGLRQGNGASAGLLINAANSPLPWDLMGFQECEDGHRVLADAQLLAQMEVFTFDPLTKTSAICMAYRRTAFQMVAQGQAWVAEDQQSQYYGKRAVQWMRLLHTASGKFVFFMNHHGPLTVDSGGKCGGQVTAFHILREMAANAKPGDAIILTGDFNANPGTPTLQVLSQRLTDFVAAGIDNIFSNLPSGSLVRNMDIGNGGSDHEARLAVFHLGGGGQGQQPAAPASPWEGYQLR